MNTWMTITVGGQSEVCQLARVLIEHRTPFSIKPCPKEEPLGPYGLYVFELTLPEGIAHSTYADALADRPK
jgi:hypothetical protein